MCLCYPPVIFPFYSKLLLTSLRHQHSVCALYLFVTSGLPWSACIRFVRHERYHSAGLHCSHGAASSWNPNARPAGPQVSTTYASGLFSWNINVDQKVTAIIKVCGFLFFWVAVCSTSNSNIMLNTFSLKKKSLHTCILCVLSCFISSVGKVHFLHELVQSSVYKF